MKNNIVLMGIITVVLAGLAFYGGMQYQKSQTPSFNRDFTRNGSRPGMMAGGDTNSSLGPRDGSIRPIAGEIISIDNESMTVKLEDGNSKIVLLSNSTNINKAEKMSLDDLKAGDTVSIFGTTNDDGSVYAQNIQMNPVMQLNGNDNKDVDISPTP